jgi:hypothetical protein
LLRLISTCLLHRGQHALTTPPCSAHACGSARPRPRRHLPRDHGCCWYGLCSLLIQKLNQIARFLAVPQQVWMDERERMMLEWNLRPNMTMLEYGSGASTLHFSRYSHALINLSFGIGHLLHSPNSLEVTVFSRAQACGAVLQRGALPGYLPTDWPFLFRVFQFIRFRRLVRHRAGDHQQHRPAQCALQLCSHEW